MENHSYNEFSMRKLFFFLKKRIWLIVVLAIVGTLGGYLWGALMVTPVYVADSQIYVYDNDAKDVNYNGLQVATQLRRDCEILITGKSVTGAVIEELGLKTTPAALAGNISVKSVENTRILNISFRDPDPQRAALILNTICEIAKDEIKEITKASVVSVVYEAEVPVAPSTQGARHYAMMGGLGALAVILILLVVLFLVDDTIHNEMDVEIYLELPTLAAIPSSKELGDGTQRTPGRKMLGGFLKGKKR